MTKPSPEPRAAALPFDDAAVERATRVLWAGLAVLALLRMVTPLSPTMWAWSLNLQRFLPPALGWGAGLLMAAVVVPPLVRPSSDAIARAGDWIVNAPWSAGAVLGLIAGVAAWVMPDRLFFVGDFVVRLGAAAANLPTDLLFPQALPLDLIVHQQMTRIVASMANLGLPAVERLFGALEAAVFAALAPAFARTLGLRGGGALAACAIVVAGGYAAMFTGFGKAFRELCVLTLVTGWAAVRVARTGRGFGWLAASGALAMAFHRSAIALLPLIVVAAFAGARPRGRGPARTPAAIATIALPVLVVALSLPRIFGAMRDIDRAHLAAGGAGAIAGRALAPVHLADVLNTIVALSPVALVALAVLAIARPRFSRFEAGVLAALVLPALAILVLVHPRQGVFRDQDVFAASGVALSLAAAWIVGAALRAPRHAWLGLATALAVVVPAGEWLLVHHDAARGAARVEAFLAEPPARDEGERALAHHFLATWQTMHDRLDEAAVHAARAAELAPSPRLLYEWGEAERARGDMAAAREAYARLVERAPPMYPGWIRLGQAALALGDLDGARDAAEHARALEPDAPDTQLLLEAIATASAPPEEPAP